MAAQGPSQMTAALC